MAVKLSPWGNQQFFDENGDPAVGWKIYTYQAGSSTEQTTYTTEAGDVAQSNPIVLNALGFPTNGQIWLTEGLTYKLVLKNASDVEKKTEDNLSGVNDNSSATSQWTSSGVTPTYVSATSFTLAGDQTSDFHVGRRLQFTTTAGTVYGTIATSAYTTLTTVTMTMDSGDALDSGLSSVSLSILRADKPALPNSDAARTALGAAALAGSSAQDFAAKNLTASGYMSSTAGDLNTVTAVNLADASATLTAAQLTGSKLFTITPTGNVTLTTDTAANIIAALTGYQVGSHVEFTIIVRAAFNVALAPGTGVTIVGETAVNQGSGTWKIRIDSASAVTIYNIGAAKTGLAAATQAEQEAGTSTAAAVTPGRQQYHPSAAKAWIKCDAAGVIQASHNITSITDDGVGLITVTIGTDFSSASYAVVASNKDDSTADQARITNITAQLAGAFSAKTVNHTPAKVDPVNWYFSCYGDQA
jgi:hypothetical protein